MGLAQALIAFIVVGLPLIVACSIVTSMLRHREKKMELEARVAEAKAVRQGDHDLRLEQRVRVLERIITDKGLDVSDEIERLRLPARDEERI